MINFFENSTQIEVRITKEFDAQASYLCAKQPNREWSGIMIYDIIDGDLDKPNKLVIMPLYIILMDIDTSTYTEFNYDEEYAKFKMEHKEYMGKPIGKIHSHNTMSTTPSGTDVGDLKDLSSNYNMYVSIITNNNGEYSGITSIKKEEHIGASETIIRTLKNKIKKIKTKARIDTIVDIFKNKFTYEFNVPDYFKSRYDDVEKQFKVNSIQQNTQRTLFGFNPAFNNTNDNVDYYNEQQIKRNYNWQDYVIKNRNNELNIVRGILGEKFNAIDNEDSEIQITAINENGTLTYIKNRTTYSELACDLVNKYPDIYMFVDNEDYQILQVIAAIFSKDKSILQEKNTNFTIDDSILKKTDVNSLIILYEEGEKNSLDFMDEYIKEYLKRTNILVTKQDIMDMIISEFSLMEKN